ncbi:MAG: hypothetical protein ACE5JD_13215 [Candidatus Methylomirabilia bacterium]
MRRATLLVALVAVGLAACGPPYVSPIPPPPHRYLVVAPYDRTWYTLIRAFRNENVPLRVVAKDSGVIASDDFATPIGVYADCGRYGDERVEGEALTNFTVYVRPVNATETEVQVNARMRTHRHRKGDSGKLKDQPVFECASTGRWEANLLDSVRRLTGE